MATKCAFLCCLVFAARINNAFQMISRRVGLKQSYDTIPVEAAHMHGLRRPDRYMASVNMTYNVLDYGAKGDNSTDNTQAFTAAFEAAHSGGGGYVYAPTGSYVFLGQLSVPVGVSLIGSYLSVPSHSNIQAPPPYQAPADGTILIARYGRGKTNESHSFLTIGYDAAVKGLTIYYDGQPCTNNSNSIVAYPPSIYMNGRNAAVEDVELLNSYIGIWAVQAHRHYIARVQGQPIYIGLYVDETHDIGRIEDVHFQTYYCREPGFLYTQTTYGRSFVFGRSDWEYVFNTFSFSYAVGYHFIETADGSMNGNFLGIGADYACNASIVVDAAQAPGLLITNGEFTSFHDDVFAPNSTAVSAQVIVNKDNRGPVVFSACSFWGPSNNIARLYGNSSITFVGSQFVEWNLQQQAADAAAIYATNGNVVVNACEFAQNGTQFQLDDNVNKAIITNNIWADGMHARISSNVKTAISNNL